MTDKKMNYSARVSTKSVKIHGSKRLETALFAFSKRQNISKLELDLESSLKGGENV